MASALVLGNVALLPDAASPRVAKAAKSWQPELSMPRPLRREPAPAATLAAHVLAFHDHADAGGEPAAAFKVTRRWRRGASAKVGAAGSGGAGGDGDDREGDWEEDLRSRLKELEEMKEIEKRAAELVAEGADGDEEETEEEKRERVRRELEKVAKEQAERRKTAKLMFELGQKAYGKGMYSRAIEFLEGALTIIPRPTLLGGEVVKDEIAGHRKIVENIHF